MVKRLTIVLAAICAACAGPSLAVTPVAHVSPVIEGIRSTCPGKPSGGSIVASVRVTVAASFVMQKPSTTPLTVQAFDVGGSLVSGNYKNPIALKIADGNPTHPHVTVDCSTIYSSTQAAPILKYDGHGDALQITVSAKGIQPVQVSIASKLPAEIQLGKPGMTTAKTPYGAIAFGSDGRMYTAMDGVVQQDNIIVPVFAAIATNGAVKTFVVHDSSQWPWQMHDARCILGGDGNAWCTAQRAGEVATVIDRIAPNGHMSTIEIPDFYDVTSMALDKHGNVWMTVSYGEILKVTPDGDIHHVAKVNDTPGNLVRDPHDRGMWFGTPHGVGLATPSGKVTTYNIPDGAGSNPIAFFYGPDGTFWAPWAGNKWHLIKFDLNGKVVSETPLAQTGVYPPVFGQYAQDAKRNTYITERYGSNAVVRLAKDGTASAYPVSGQSAWGVAASGGKIYVTDIVPLNNGINPVGGLVVIDPAYW